MVCKAEPCKFWLKWDKNSGCLDMYVPFCAYQQCIYTDPSFIVNNKVLSSLGLYCIEVGSVLLFVCNVLKLHIWSLFHATNNQITIQHNCIFVYCKQATCSSLSRPSSALYVKTYCKSVNLHTLHPFLWDFTLHYSAQICSCVRWWFDWLFVV